MNDAPMASRPAPPQIEPVEHDGIRYEEDKVYSEDGDQNGGYLAAFDTESGEKLWRVKVYEVRDYSAEGIDNIGLHFRSMTYLADSDEIEIVNESGSRFRVSLTTRTSVFIDGPSPDSNDEVEEDTRPPPPSPSQ